MFCMNPIEKAKRIKDLIQLIADLTSKIASADPTVGWRDAAGNWISRVGQLQAELAAAEAELASLGGASAGAGAAGTVASKPGLVVRAGRAAINFGRWVLRKPPLPPLAAGGLVTAAGVVVLTAIAAAGVYVAANVAGSYFGDNPILAGPAMNKPLATAVDVPGANFSDKYAIFILPNSGGTVWIGDEDQLKTLRSCDTPNGGLCDDPNITYPPVSYERKSEDFATYDEALSLFCRSTVQKPGYWGNKAEGFGGLYWSTYPCG